MVILMSKAPSLNPDDMDVPDDNDPEQLVEDHRELFERLADADLPASEYFENALAHVDDVGGDGDDV